MAKVDAAFSQRTLCPSLDAFSFTDASTTLVTLLAEPGLVSMDLEMEVPMLVDFDAEDEYENYHNDVDESDAMEYAKDLEHAVATPFDLGTPLNVLIEWKLVDASANQFAPPATALTSRPQPHDDDVNGIDACLNSDYESNSELEPDLNSELKSFDPDSNSASMPSTDEAQNNSQRAPLFLTSDAYSYFDSSAFKNWAGPDYWKKQKRFAVPQQSDEQHQPGKSANSDRFIPRSNDFSALTEKHAKKEKGPALIDFLSDLVVDESILFARESRRGGGVKMELDNFHLLPPDHHHTTQIFHRLFLKPRHHLQVQKLHTTLISSFITSQRLSNGNWGTHRPPFHDSMQEMDGPPLQSFDDDDDAPVDFESAAMAEQSHHQPPPPSNFTFQPQEQLHDQIHHSKQAKRVDVNALKKNIWDSIQTTHVHHTPFTSIIESVKLKYPVQKAKDITVSFYFICLLHLANENNLVVEESGDLSELFISSPSPLI